MTMTDPIADMLTRIRNANSAQFETVTMPGSKLKAALAAILEREGFIAGYKVEQDPKGPGSQLAITLKYTADRTGTIGGIKRVSKPGEGQDKGGAKSSERKIGFTRLDVNDADSAVPVMIEG